jgi:hypothetical protein
MKLKKNIIYVLLFLSANIHAQIGINTETPTATLSIKSGSTTQPVVKTINSDNTELFRLLDNGYLGIGTTSPVVKLDLRSTTTSGELGLGTTSMIAVDAQAGAIRYNNGIEYSDGTTWIKLTTLPTKAYIIAKNGTGLPLPIGSTPYDKWTVDKDATNSFNASTGVFTAPRTGVYSISCTVMVPNIISETNPLRLELNLSVSSSTATNVKSAAIAPIKGTGVNMAVVNKVFLYFNAGDKCWFSIWHNMNITNMNTSTDASFNTLTISEM